jgi:hypothetical protein
VAPSALRSAEVEVRLMSKGLRAAVCSQPGLSTSATGPGATEEPRSPFALTALPSGA